jgi:hypothetical protein
MFIYFQYVHTHTQRTIKAHFGKCYIGLKYQYESVRFQVLTAAHMKMTAFWDIVPCSLVEEIALMMEAVCTSETSVNFYGTTRRNIPKGCHLK